MYKTTLSAISLTLLLVGCSSSGTPRQAANDLEPRPFAPEPRQVAVDEYLEFLDELAVAVGEGVPRELDAREQRQFRDYDSQLRSILGPVQSVDELSDESQRVVFNLHQQLQGVVVGDPDNHVICSQRHTVGTHFKQVSCMPAADFRREQERSRSAIRHRLGAGPMPCLDAVDCP